MAGEDDILQRIILQGAQEAEKELKALGDEGQKAFDKIAAAGGGDFAQGLRKISPEIKKFQNDMAAAAGSAQQLPNIFQRVGTAINNLKGATFGKAFAKDADEAASAGTNFGTTVRGIGKDIRALGRATQLVDIGIFGRSLSLVGRNIGLIAFPAAIAGLGALSNMASNASEKVLDLAASVQQTPQAFTRVAAVVIALGGGFDDAAKTIGTFEKNIATGVQSTEQAAVAIAGAREALDGARDSFSEATKAYAPLQFAQKQLAFQFAAGKVTIEQYNDATHRLQLQFTQTGEAVVKAGDAIDKAQKNLDKARAATTPLEDAFRKVGITLSDAFQKLPVDQQLKRIAVGFKNLGPEVDKVKLAVQLLGEEMGRKLVDALSGGEKSLAKFQAEGERIRPAFTAAQQEVGKNFARALGQLESALSSLSDAIGIAIAPAFIDFFKALINIIVENRAGIAAFGQALGSVLKPILNGVGIAIQAVVTAISFLQPVFAGLAKLINSVFGTNLTGVQLFAIAIVALIAALAPMVPLVALAATAIALLVQQLSKIDFSPITNGAKAAFTSVVNFALQLWAGLVTIWTTGIGAINALWQGVVDGVTVAVTGVTTTVTGLWTAIQTLFQTGIDFIKNGFNSAVDSVKGAFQAFLDYLKGWVQSGLTYIQSLIDKVKSLIGVITGANASAANADAGQGQAFARGGAVRGRGTGTSDSIWAKISNGEYVVKAEAVKRVGVGFLNAINSLRMPQAPTFNMGGFVDALMPMRSVPRFAEGGAVTTTSRRSFSLNIGGNVFSDLTAPDDTADRMIKFATVRSARSAGKKPTWFGQGGR